MAMGRVNFQCRCNTFFFFSISYGRIQALYYAKELSILPRVFIFAFSTHRFRVLAVRIYRTYGIRKIYHKYHVGTDSLPSVGERGKSFTNNDISITPADKRLVESQLGGSTD
jgi:hypothetical protein